MPEPTRRRPAQLLGRSASAPAYRLTPSSAPGRVFIIMAVLLAVLMSITLSAGTARADDTDPSSGLKPTSDEQQQVAALRADPGFPQDEAVKAGVVLLSGKADGDAPVIPRGTRCVNDQSATEGSYSLCMNSGQGTDKYTPDATLQSTSARAACDRLPINGGPYKDRFVRCENTDVAFAVRRKINGVWTVTGTLKAFILRYVYAAAASDSPQWIDEVRIYPYSITGVDGNSIFLTSTPYCHGFCKKVDSTRSTAGKLVLNRYTTVDTAYDTTKQAKGDESWLDSAWNFTWRSTAAPEVYTDQLAIAQVRCDNNTPGRKRGCVTYGATAQMKYDSSSGMPLITKHISAAIGSKLSAFLNRDTDTTARDRRRAEVCPSSIRVSGLSCDEYPFASTQQGGRNGVDVRTFPNICPNTPGSTTVSGSTGASRCMVPTRQEDIKGEQDIQGTFMSKFYGGNRVINGDRFLVTAVPF